METDLTAKTTLVLGASPNPQRYSYLAVRNLRAKGIPVIAVGKRLGEVADISLQTTFPSGKNVHTVTLYLNAANQQPYETAILDLRPQRIIFNPGAENPGFAARARKAGIQTMEACTLVLLSTGQY
ncbi:CoA-binding protein [Compostibacter hankyongensis]|uniref:CoA-binding protein n=1 Tax=Compostibacter hankyongensis TaxID=1007089 RepID=A0ABP8G894_9BACT